MRRTAAALLGALLAALVIAGAVLGLVGPSPTQAATQAASGQDEDRRVVRVGTEGTYPPFTYREGSGEDDLTGYDIDVIEAVADEAGWDLEFVESQFDAIFAALDSGRIDVIANQISFNPERDARYALSEPYTYSQGVIVTRSDDDSITSLDDLEGVTTAQSSTSNWAEIAREAGADVQTVEGFAPAAELLAQGRVDAIVNDNIAVLDYLNTSGSDEIKIAGEAGDEGSEQVLAFRKEDQALAEEANAALDALREDGTLAEISESYFRADVSVPDGGDADLSGGREGRTTWEAVQDTAWPMFVAMVKITIPLTVVSFAIGLVLAVAVALARISRSRVLAGLARAFVSIIRGTPLLVQLFIVFFGLGQIGIRLDPFVAATIALSLNVAGYASEVVRSAILSVPKGQFEAATTIGLDYRQTLRRIVFPQAARTAVPPLSNTLLSLTKDTSLASTVLLTELFRVAQVSAGANGQYLALYSVAAVYYWVVCTILSVAQTRLEKRLDRYVA